MAIMPTRRFFITDIDVQCSIGIYEHERQAKQRVLINIEVVLDPMAEPSADAIEEGLDYDMIRDAVIRLASAKHYDLQETLARAIFDEMLRLPTVVEACVRTAKTDIYEDCKEAAYQLSNITS